MHVVCGGRCCSFLACPISDAPIMVIAATVTKLLHLLHNDWTAASWGMYPVLVVEQMERKSAAQ